MSAEHDPLKHPFLYTICKQNQPLRSFSEVTVSFLMYGFSLPNSISNISFLHLDNRRQNCSDNWVKCTLMKHSHSYYLLFLSFPSFNVAFWANGWSQKMFSKNQTVTLRKESERGYFWAEGVVFASQFGESSCDISFYFFPSEHGNESYNLIGS